MKTKIMKNVFNTFEIEQLKSTIEETLSKSTINEFEDQAKHDQDPYNQYIYLNQGRKDLYHVIFPDNINTKITNIAKELTLKDLFLCGVQYTEYVGNLNGNPSLGMHYDGGEVDFILDYQLDSNFSWGIGIEDEVYEINDNELMVLRPVSNFHYRPKKIFKKDQYLKMIFFKFMETDFSKYQPIILEKEKLDRINDIYENYYKGDKNGTTNNN